MLFLYEHYRNYISSGRIMGYYSMTLVWSTYCKFVFPTWTSQSDVTFIIGCVVTLLLAVFSMALPKIRKRIEKILFSYDSTPSLTDQEYQQVNQLGSLQKESIRLTKRQMAVKKIVIPIIYSLIYSFLHVVIMLVMMSMNGYVILAIIVGYTLGFLLFSDSCKLKEQKTCRGGCHEKK